MSSPTPIGRLGQWEPNQTGYISVSGLPQGPLWVASWPISGGRWHFLAHLDASSLASLMAFLVSCLYLGSSKNITLQLE